MARPDGEQAPNAEDLIVLKVQKKGLHSLALEDVVVAHKSKSFPETWRRITGQAMSESLRAQMADRLNRANRLKEEQQPIADVDRTDPRQSFLQAVDAGDAEAVRKLLESRDRKRLTVALDEQQRTCAHIAAKKGHVEVLRLLHDHMAELESKDKFGRTPLHLACEYGKPTSELLLFYRCQTSAEDKRGRTALHLAACCEDPSICQLLVRRAPQLVHRLDSHRRTPLFYSVLNQHAQAQAEVTRLLLQHHADANAPDAYGMAPLHYAAEEGRKPAVTVLIEHRANPSLEDAVNGRTPLQLASTEGTRRELKRSEGGKAAALAEQTGRNAAHASSGNGAMDEDVPVGPSGGRSRGKVRERPPASPRPPSARPRSVERPPVAPEALGVHFHALRERFIQIMERVQEGGVQQLEHVKRPRIFTGCWMIDVSTHQQLLGQVLKNVPGPEVCMRIFNLLRPPSSLPASKGDEKDIISYYADGPDDGRQGWGGSDPYTSALAEGPEEDGLSQARRVELLRTIQELKHELEAKDAVVTELRRKTERLQADLAARGDQEEAAVINAEVERCRRQVASQADELGAAKLELRQYDGQIKTLRKEIELEKSRSADLLSEQVGVRRQLEQEWTRRGEEQQWELMLELERSKSEQVQSRLAQKADEAQAKGLSSEVAAAQLRAKVQALHSELSQNASEAVSATELERLRRDNIERSLAVERLRSDLEEAQRRLCDEEESSMRRIANEMRRTELEELTAQEFRGRAAEVPELESEVVKLKEDMRSQDECWQKMFSQYHLIGQALFGAEG